MSFPEDIFTEQQADPDTLALMRATIGSGPAGGCACVEDRHRPRERLLAALALHYENRVDQG